MERGFLLKLAKAYQIYDVSIIEDYLADDMHYASMWVFHEMTSKKEYIDESAPKPLILKDGLNRGNTLLKNYNDFMQNVIVFEPNSSNDKV